METVILWRSLWKEHIIVPFVLKEQLCAQYFIMLRQSEQQHVNPITSLKRVPFLNSVNSVRAFTTAFNIDYCISHNVTISMDVTQDGIIKSET